MEIFWETQIHARLWSRKDVPLVNLLPQEFLKSPVFPHLSPRSERPGERDISFDVRLSLRCAVPVTASHLGDRKGSYLWFFPGPSGERVQEEGMLAELWAYDQVTQSWGISSAQPPGTPGRLKIVGTGLTRMPKCLYKNAGQEARTANGLVKNEERREVNQGVEGRKENTAQKSQAWRPLPCLRK